MKTLVAFYSLEGNTKYIAEAIAEQLKADLLEIKPKKEYPSKGFQKYFWGGKSVLFNEYPELINQNVDLSEYQNIVLGTPVWAGSCSAPLHSFIRRYPFTGKKIALFACHAGGTAEKCFAKLKEELPDNTFVGRKDFVDPLKHKKEDCAKEAAQWAANLQF